MDMNNNDILIRIRYAFDLKDNDMVEIFKLGDLDISVEGVQKILTKIDLDNMDLEKICTNNMLDSFLNGFIVYKRGKQESKPGEAKRPILSINDNKSINNIVLKKLKTALELKSDDVLDILKSAGVIISKTELSAVLRKEGERHYKECGDRYLRNFLKGLTMKYRK